MERLTKRHGKHAVQIEAETRRNDPGWQRLAEIEDLAEQGRLVELPVPIGTKIYVRCMSCPPTYKPEYCTDWKDDVEQGCENCPHRILIAIEDEFDYSYIHLFGENVFLTREEAEATSTTTRSWEVSGDA